MTIEIRAVVTLLFQMRQGIPTLFVQFLLIMREIVAKRGICVVRREKNKVSSYPRCH